VGGTPSIFPAKGSLPEKWTEPKTMAEYIMCVAKEIGTSFANSTERILSVTVRKTKKGEMRGKAGDM